MSKALLYPVIKTDSCQACTYNEVANARVLWQKLHPRQVRDICPAKEGPEYCLRRHLWKAGKAMSNDRIAKYEKAVESIKEDLERRKARSHGGKGEEFFIGHLEGFKAGLEFALNQLEAVEGMPNLSECPEAIDSEEHTIHQQLMASRKLKSGMRLGDR